MKWQEHKRLRMFNLQTTFRYAMSCPRNAKHLHVPMLCGEARRAFSACTFFCSSRSALSMCQYSSVGLSGLLGGDVGMAPARKLALSSSPSALGGSLLGPLAGGWVAAPGKFSFTQYVLV